MSLAQSQQFQEIQRIQVEVEGPATSQRLKIAVENFDAGLGWYSAGSLSIPIHQLPLLEQQLEAIRQEPAARAVDSDHNVIPFPGLRVAPRG